MENRWLGLKLSLLLTAGGLTGIAEAAGAQSASEAGAPQILKAAAAKASPDSLVTGTALFSLVNEAIASPPSSSLAPTDDADRLAQTDSTPVAITDIQIESTETGLQIVLTTAEGELAAPDTSTVSGNALILEIPHATLVQAEFQEFQPAEGIALIQASELPGDRVRLVITGADAAPVAEVDAAATDLVLNITPGVAITGDVAEDAIQIGVVGADSDDYVVPNATTATRTDTPLRDIPQSIQVIPQAVLEDQ